MPDQEAPSGSWGAFLRGVRREAFANASALQRHIEDVTRFV
jgi:hypothetical protein